MATMSSSRLMVILRVGRRAPASATWRARRQPRSPETSPGISVSVLFRLLIQPPFAAVRRSRADDPDQRGRRGRALRRPADQQGPAQAGTDPDPAFFVVRVLLVESLD